MTDKISSDRFRTSQQDPTYRRATVPLYVPSRKTSEPIAETETLPVETQKARKRPQMKMVFGGMSAIILLIGAGGAFYITHSYKNPLPANIKSQVSYKAIYPSKTKQIDPASYDYRPDQKTLTFIANVAGNNIVFTEQPAPESLGSAGQIYYPALGIHPYAQFATKLGPVALARFWQSGSLKPAGQSGILASGGTFLTAHSDKNLTNTEWKDLFDSLKITK